MIAFGSVNNDTIHKANPRVIIEEQTGSVQKEQTGCIKSCRWQKFWGENIYTECYSNIGKSAWLKIYGTKFSSNESVLHGWTFGPNFQFTGYTKDTIFNKILNRTYEIRNMRVMLSGDESKINQLIKDKECLLLTSIFGASEGPYIAAYMRRILKVLFITSSYKTKQNLTT